MSGLDAFLARRTGGPAPQVEVFVATVTAWVGSGNNTTNAKGSDYTDALTLDGATFAVGDVVALLGFRGRYIILGKLA